MNDEQWLWYTAITIHRTHFFLQVYFQKATNNIQGVSRNMKVLFVFFFNLLSCLIPKRIIKNITWGHIIVKLIKNKIIFNEINWKILKYMKEVSQNYSPTVNVSWDTLYLLLLYLYCFMFSTFSTFSRVTV